MMLRDAVLVPPISFDEARVRQQAKADYCRNAHLLLPKGYQHRYAHEDPKLIDIAFHEAGHILIAQVLGWEVNYSTIEVFSRAESLPDTNKAFTYINYPSCSRNHMGLATFKSFARLAMAGHAAAIQLYGCHYHAGSRGDINGLKLRQLTCPKAKDEPLAKIIEQAVRYDKPLIEQHWEIIESYADGLLNQGSIFAHEGINVILPPSAHRQRRMLGESDHEETESHGVRPPQGEGEPAAEHAAYLST